VHQDSIDRWSLKNRGFLESPVWRDARWQVDGKMDKLIQEMDDTSKQLLSRYRKGDSRAADEIFERYVRRLIELARARLSTKLSRRVDPEDIVQSAYRSFFVRARDGDYVLERAGDLWRLLAAITVNKLHGQIERHFAQRRAVSREEDIGHPAHGTATDDPADVEPTADEAVAIAEQLELFMETLGHVERRVLELRLQGNTIEQIADDVDRSQRTVRRLLQRVQHALEQQLDAA
jgi:RNA polymerase sigma factor (sigma-70 family)